MDNDSKRISEKRYIESEEWNERYSRQIRLDNVGIDGQVGYSALHLIFRKRYRNQKFWLLEQED